MQIFIFRDGKSLGPYDLADLRNLNVTGETLIWYKGIAEWIPAKDAEPTRSMFVVEESAPVCPPPAPAPEAPGAAVPPEGACEPCSPAQEAQPQQPYPEPQEPEPQQACPAAEEPAAQQNYSYQAPYEPVSEERPNNYLWISIVCLCCCCMPAGIYSLIKSTEINSAWALGDYERAENCSRQARLWGLIGIGVGAAFWIIYIAFYVFLGVSGAFKI